MGFTKRRERIRISSSQFRMYLPYVVENKPPPRPLIRRRKIRKRRNSKLKNRERKRGDHKDKMGCETYFTAFILAGGGYQWSCQTKINCGNPCTQECILLCSTLRAVVRYWPLHGGASPAPAGSPTALAGGGHGERPAGRLALRRREDAQELARTSSLRTAFWAGCTPTGPLECLMRSNRSSSLRGYLCGIFCAGGGWF